MRGDDVHEQRIVGQGFSLAKASDGWDGRLRVAERAAQNLN
jgi:hypothetical protein